MAHESLSRAGFCKGMEEMEIPSKWIKLEDTHCQVTIMHHLSNLHKITNWVRQGDTLICLLFNLAIDKVIRDAEIQSGLNYSQTTLTSLEGVIRY